MRRPYRCALSATICLGDNRALARYARRLRSTRSRHAEHSDCRNVSDIASALACSDQRSRFLADGDGDGAYEDRDEDAGEESQVRRRGDQNPRGAAPDRGDAQRRSPRSAHHDLAGVLARGGNSDTRRRALRRTLGDDRRLRQGREPDRDASRARRRPCRPDRLEVGDGRHEGFRHRQLSRRTYRRDRRPGGPRQSRRALPGRMDVGDGGGALPREGERSGSRRRADRRRRRRRADQAHEPCDADGVLRGPGQVRRRADAGQVHAPGVEEHASR